MKKIASGKIRTHNLQVHLKYHCLHLKISTVKLCYNELLGTGQLILFVINGVRYNRVNLCNNVTNFP
jgi:hypothetical protein